MNILLNINLVYSCIVTTINYYHQISINYFCQGISIHKYNTRYSCHYRSYPARTKVMQFSVKCSGPKFWNTLPQELIQDLPLVSLRLKSNTTYCPRSFKK